MFGGEPVDFLVYNLAARFVPRFSKSAFTFGPEFGARLRALRKAREVAELAAKTFNIWKVKLPPTPQQA